MKKFDTRCETCGMLCALSFSLSVLTSLWLPPARKAKDVMSMGYDPFDFYDPGEYQQKYRDRKETWFGSKEDLSGLISTAHDSGIQVIADLVLNQ